MVYIQVSIHEYNISFVNNYAVATVNINGAIVTEPRSSQNMTVATLTLTTSSGGALKSEVVVTVTATEGTASEYNFVIPLSQISKKLFDLPGN